MKKIIFIAALSISLLGCETTQPSIKLMPEALTGQRIIDQGGADAVISHKNTSAAVRPPSEAFLLESRPMLYISVYSADKPFDFSTEDIQVFVDGNSHRVFTYDDLVNEVDQEQGRIAEALNSKYKAQTRKTAEDAVKSSSDPEVFSPSDNSNTIGDSSNYGYKLDVNSIAQDQGRNNAMMQAQEVARAKQKQQAVSFLSKNVLKNTTVQPKTWYRKYVVVEKIPGSAQSSDINVIIKVAGEKHEFLLKHFKQQQ